MLQVKLLKKNEYNGPLSTHSNTGTNVEQFPVVKSSNNLMNVENVKCVLLPLVAVNVNGRLDTVALLDTASTHSFVKRSLVDKLSLKGTKTKLSLSTMNHESETSTQFFRLKVQGHGGHAVVIDRAYQVEDIPIPDVTMKKEYSHLSDLEVPDL